MGRWGWTVQLPVGPRVRVSAGQAPSGVGASRSRPFLAEEPVPFGGGGVDVLGAGVPAQSFAGQVGEVGVELLEVGERRGTVFGPVPDGCHDGGPARCCGPACWWAGRGGPAPAGGWSAGNGTARHQLIVDDPTDTPLGTSGRGPGPGVGEREPLEGSAGDDWVQKDAPVWSAARAGPSTRHGPGLPRRRASGGAHGLGK